MNGFSIDLLLEIYYNFHMANKKKNKRIRYNEETGKVLITLPVSILEEMQSLADEHEFSLSSIVSASVLAFVGYDGTHDEIVFNGGSQTADE